MGAAPKADLKTWQTVKSHWINSISRTEESNIRKILVEVESDDAKLLDILDHQHYSLSYWKSTEREINYRRFFTVNQLICLRMEDEAVFDEYHSFLRTLYKENIIQGFRIDHIDGLRDPGTYIQRLRSLFGDTCYIIAEKILEAKEAIPETWPLQGTSGYEFLAYVNQLFTDRKGAKTLVEFYEKLVPELPGYKQMVDENKRMILENFMSGEWDNLTNYFLEQNLSAWFEREAIKQALGAVLVSLPVYRIYPDDLPLTGNDLVIMAEAIQKAKHLAPSYTSVLNHFNELIVSPPQDLKTNAVSFLKRMMQFAGPLTAKGVEDTTFYMYNPLISHDEVGDSPSTMGITINEFHARMIGRQQATPFSLNATATHDTKRGEDVRIRINVLSEIPGQWITIVQKWFEINKDAHVTVNGKPAPAVNDEYFIYQSILGGFPDDIQPSENWVARVQEYLIKAFREAKVNTSWESPDENYENACTSFVDKIINHNNEFRKSLMQFLKDILPYGNANAIGQMLIKVTAPGIPDMYQGCELWDLSYVDPDNRRPVDYKIRKNYLAQIREKEKDNPANLFSFLSDNRELGIEKLFVAWKALNFRRANSKIFSHGEYMPLQVSGRRPVACAYARNYEDDWVLIIVPLALATTNDWTDESVFLPAQLSGSWTNVFTRQVVEIAEYVSLREILLQFPLGFLTTKIPVQDSVRG
jgi:(1->4)-alpha-D-glucan 1-alpha-D-glucosylmutase